jgi:polysaccharide biosynthesis PFTS motif protein
VYRSFFVADEYWTWNRAVAEWLERIQIGLISDSTQFRAIGANMCGNREYLQLSSADARRMIGMPEAHFVIGVFDVPALSNDWMEHAAGGPRLISLEYAEAFFHGMNALLEKLPDVSIFLKLKRALDEDLRAYPRSLRRLLERGRDGTGRVTVLDVNIDPFLPIAACDAALGMFFTSPVLLALANGRKGGYYDPLGAASHPTEKEYLQFILRSEDSLISAVKSWTEKREQPQVPSSGRLLPRTVKNSFRHYCYNAPPRESESRHG